MSSFHINISRELFHPNEEVNEIIREGFKNSMKPEQMITSIEGILGSRGIWETYTIVNSFKNKNKTFEEMISDYFELPVLLPHSQANDEYQDKCFEDLQIQRDAYEKPTEEDITEVHEDMVKRYVKSRVFRNCIFVEESRAIFNRPNFVKSNETDEDPQAVVICNMLLRDLGLSDYNLKQKVSWWVGYRDLIHSRISYLRSQVVRRISVNFESFYHQWNSNKVKHIYFGDMMNAFDEAEQNEIANLLLDLNIDKDIYREFLDLALSTYYPLGKFNLQMKRALLSDVITPTEEAFGLLVFENNYSNWKWTLEGKSGDDLLDMPQPKLLYQSEVKQTSVDGKTGGKKKSVGHWNEDGIVRMNWLVDKIEELRGTKERQDFEKDIMKMYVAGITETEMKSGWIDTNRKSKRMKTERTKVKNRLVFI